MATFSPFHVLQKKTHGPAGALMCASTFSINEDARGRIPITNNTGNQLYEKTGSTLLHITVPSFNRGWHYLQGVFADSLEFRQFTLAKRMAYSALY